MFDAIRKAYIRSFTWDSGISLLPEIKEIVIIRNVLKPKSKKAKRRAMAKARV